MLSLFLENYWPMHMIDFLLHDMISQYCDEEALFRGLHLIRIVSWMACRIALGRMETSRRSL